MAGRNISIMKSERYVAINPISIGVFCPTPNLSRINRIGITKGSVIANDII